jgi:hypothetical protein
MMVSKDLKTFIPLREAPPELHEKAVRIFQEKERKEKERVARFGQIRPQISVVWRGQRWVTVRNKMYYSDKWQFFPDFLRDYMPQVFGIDWCKAEAAKPEAQRHPVITWRTQALTYLNAQPPQPDGSRVAPPTGALAAYMCFAYDLYVVDDNGALDATLLERLKNTEQFQGARHELFAEATCYRGGFTVQHENEKDVSTRHAEFTAKHIVTGQLLSIEAKSRHRAGVLGRPGNVEERPSFTFARLINDAVDKRPTHPLVIFLDTNLPSKWAGRVLRPQAGNLLSRPMQILLEEIKKEHDDKDPYCMLIFSNHPHHYAIHDQDPHHDLLSVVSQQPQANLAALRSLHIAASLYGNVPQSFSTDESEPPPPANPVYWPKVQYNFEVDETSVRVVRENQRLVQTFSTEDKDRPQAHSRLHEFLEDLGLSRVDAHAICQSIEAGNSVYGVYAQK